MDEFDLLITNTNLVMPDHSVVEDVAIAVSGEMIEGIFPSASGLKGKDVINGVGKLVIPGLYDCHTHSVQQLLKGGTVDEPPIIWRRILVPYEEKMTPEDRYHAARLYCLQSMKNGVVMFADAGSMDMAPVAEAVQETGMHAVLSRVGRDLDKELPAAMCDPDAETCMKHQQEMFDTYNGANGGKIRVFYSLSSPMSSSRELASGIAEMAKKDKTGIHIHLGEHPAEVQTCLARFKMRPPEFLESCGVFDNHVIAAHCIQLTDFDMHVLKRDNFFAVHCPTANLPTQGMPKLLAERAAGIHIALGNDGASSARQDILCQAQLLKYATQPVYGTPVFEPNVLPLEEAFDMCTVNGAHALCCGDKQGKIEKGMKATFAVYDINNVNYQPTRNLFKTFMMNACGDSVTDLVVDGKIVIKNKEFVTLDEEKILYEGKLQLRKMLSRTA